MTEELEKLLNQVGTTQSFPEPLANRKRCQKLSVELEIGAFPFTAHLQHVRSTQSLYIWGDFNAASKIIQHTWGQDASTTQSGSFSQAIAIRFQGWYSCLYLNSSQINVCAHSNNTYTQTAKKCILLPQVHKRCLTRFGRSRLILSKLHTHMIHCLLHAVMKSVLFERCNFMAESS